MLCCVEDQHNDLLHYPPLLNNACVRLFGQYMYVFQRSLFDTKPTMSRTKHTYVCRQTSRTLTFPLPIQIQAEFCVNVTFELDVQRCQFNLCREVLFQHLHKQCIKDTADAYSNPGTIIRNGVRARFTSTLKYTCVFYFNGRL